MKGHAQGVLKRKNYYPQVSVVSSRLGVVSGVELLKGVGCCW